MSTNDSGELLRAFVEKGSEAAFQELVTRYIDLVYSVALRRVGGDAHQAQDVAQTVFTNFADKACSLSSSVQLGGWLHRHTCFVAANFTRSERRRQAREQIAVQMNTLSGSPDADWKDVAPVLDEAIDHLDDTDRDAVVLRFYEECDLRHVGTALGISEDAAQKRVSRALDKLRDLLVQRGVSLSVAALAAELASQAIMAAPVGLARSIVGNSLAKSAAATGGLAGILGLLTPTTIKVIFCATVMVGVAMLVWHQSRTDRLTSLPPPSFEAASTKTTTANTAGENLSAGESAITADNSEVPAANAEIIRLTILTADSGKPVPNVLIDYRGWVEKKFTGKKFMANREGVCAVPVSRETLTDLQLTTRIDGFADTRLYWRPDRGEKIPTNYTVRLVRSVPISGKVVDGDDKPVEGAKVGFNHHPDPVASKPPEDHQFKWIETTTDANGLWKIDRIAPEMIRTIYGGARHSNYLAGSVGNLQSQNGETEKQLRDGTHIIRLRPPLSIRGLVVGPDDQAIPNATVFIGRDDSGRRDVRSSNDGTFVAPGAQPGMNLVTAEARGYAPVTIEIPVAEESQPVRLKMKLSKKLILRIVDPHGQPVPKANVWLRKWGRSDNSKDQAPPLQARFSPTTDKDGLAVWEDAPDRELAFDAHAQGFMRMNDIRIQPDGREHTVTLQPALIVLGDVRDADSNELIPRFQINCGWPGDPITGVMWSRMDEHRLSFSGGTYRHAFEEALVNGNSNGGYVLRFEAEGHAPYVSRVIRADEGEVRIDAMLPKATLMTVSVLLPSGRPASHADVGFVYPGARLKLVPGGISQVDLRTGPALHRTDAQGRFQLSRDPSVVRVIIAHKEGYAEIVPAALTTEPTVRLQLWGRIEGNYMSGGQPAVGRHIKFDLGQGGWNTVTTDLDSFRTQIDAQGRFIFAQVPPGKHKLVRMLAETNGTTTSWMSRPLTDVEVQPGETKTITLAITGYTITARGRWPEGIKRDNSWRAGASVSTPFSLPSPEIMANKELLAKWRSSPEIQALIAITRSYPMTEKSDGLWQAEDVPAGSYDARISLMKGNLEPSGVGEHFSGTVPITVPADPPSGTLDVGEIVLQKIEQK